MPSVTTSCAIALFADDSIYFMEINSLDDCHSLQTDLTCLGSWSKSWLVDLMPVSAKISLHVYLAPVLLFTLIMLLMTLFLRMLEPPAMHC